MKKQFSMKLSAVMKYEAREAMKVHETLDANDFENITSAAEMVYGDYVERQRELARKAENSGNAKAWHNAALRVIRHFVRLEETGEWTEEVEDGL